MGTCNKVTVSPLEVHRRGWADEIGSACGTATVAPGAVYGGRGPVGRVVRVRRGRTGPSVTVAPRFSGRAEEEVPKQDVPRLKEG